MQLLSGDWSALGTQAQGIRLAVFVREQGVPLEMELDEFDALSWHVLIQGDSGQPLATGRLLPDGHIGRLAVLAGWRGKGLGRQMMAGLMAQARLRGLACVLVNAQLSALDFYAQLGFVAEGAVFMDAGIAHQSMRLIF